MEGGSRCHPRRLSVSPPVAQVSSIVCLLGDRILSRLGTPPAQGPGACPPPHPPTMSKERSEWWAVYCVSTRSLNGDALR